MMDYSLFKKLREKYEKAILQYGKQFFSINKLEERIYHTLSNKLDITEFMKNEIIFFEKSKILAEQKIAKTKNLVKSQEVVNKIISENDKRVLQYPDAFFDPIASSEMRRLVGAVTRFINHYFPVVEILFKGGEAWKDIKEVYGILERFYIQDNAQSNLFLQNYILDKKNSSDGMNEVVDTRYIQTGGNALLKMEELLIFCKKNKSRSSSADKLKISGDKKELIEFWRIYTEMEALNMVIKYITDILDNFRLRQLASFRGQN